MKLQRQDEFQIELTRAELTTLIAGLKSLWIDEPYDAGHDFEVLYNQLNYQLGFFPEEVA